MITSRRRASREHVSAACRAGLLLAAACLLSLQPIPVSGQPEGGAALSEYQLKAVYLYNFAKYVTWPAQAFANPQEPIELGLLGTPPFGNFLDQAIRDEMINGRRLVVLRSNRLQDLKRCHILFVARAETERFLDRLDELRDASILTVGETEGFAERGGMINLLNEGQRIRYEINVAAARRAHLTVSSKLLKLARVIGAGEQE